MSDLKRLCWFCEHFQFEAGEQGYSEVTPGYDSTSECKVKPGQKPHEYPQYAKDCELFKWHSAIIEEYHPEGTK